MAADQLSLNCNHSLVCEVSFLDHWGHPQYNDLYINLYISLNSSVYISIYVLRSDTFFYCAMMDYIHSYCSNQIESDLKSIIHEFLLFFKLLKKHSIQYLTIELRIMN